ncbi:MAG: phosphoribosylformylglycinamidine cyclo-ligase [Bacteroidia bacterium]|nr:phosphoribosylformylglycinamidine cyclo-ligase [Bacteroidia bacterium]MDW8158614.1 phosphoribosylformylglycinamidine cyclo-ligase [Bacteroidia bacterium]
MDSYLERGVSWDKSDLHTIIAKYEQGLRPKTFCKILPDLGDKSGKNAFIMHSDTAGTKPIIAYLYWKETGDISVWEGIVQDALVMNLDDIGCAGVCNHLAFTCTIARNRFRIPSEVLEVLIASSYKWIDKLASWNIEVAHAGGETADVADIVRTLDIGFTVAARAPLNQIKEIHLHPGQVIIGVASFGQTKFEQEYNSGIGCNGLTNARHDLLNKTYAQNYPESFEGQLPYELVYAGKNNLLDPLPETPLNIGKALLSPTRIYMPVLKLMWENYRDDIGGVIHCTGGGQTKCLRFAQGVHILKDNLFATPPIFRVIQQTVSISWKNMLQTYNMGHRLEIYTHMHAAVEIIALFQEFGYQAQIIGAVQPPKPNKTLTILYNGESYEW